MAKNIFKSIIVVAMLVLIVSAFLITRQIYTDFSDARVEELKLQTTMLGYGVSRDGIDYLEDFEQFDNRITIINSDGKVLFDNSGDINVMDNHLDRQEVAQAIKEGFGLSKRYSSTLMKQLIYTAIKMDNGWILRLSSEYSSVYSIILSTISPILFVVLIMAFVSTILAGNLTKKIVAPFNEIDLDNPDINSCYKEIKPFMERIALQQSQINENIISLQRKKQEFEAITENMNEGMILLNSKGIILEMNKFASEVFSIEKHEIGSKITSLKCYQYLQDLLDETFQHDHSHKKIKISDITCEVDTSPVKIEDQISGFVLMVFDVTYKEINEKLRREFSSNVSHELKTPIQTISGYAELLTSNFAKPQDYQIIGEKIHSESLRMSSLINDIINLSHLDDDSLDIDMSDINIYELTKTIIAGLQSEAEKNHISLNFAGTKETVYGNQQLLESIIFNLIDNAIRYNKPNGSINVELSNDEHKIYFKVSDTGIGIDEKDFDRIFERFYRANKTKSKEVGGTGLGLSIVKHACLLSKAKIEVESKLNEGSTFTVIFDKK